MARPATAGIGGTVRLTAFSARRWVKGITDRLAPSTVGVVHGVVSGIFRAAVRDRLIVANPCDGTRLPKATPSRVEPLPLETVHALADAVPARYRALVILAAGSGMRQGECLGLTVDRLDFLRRVVHVDRQLVTVTGRPSFLTAPKTAASVRTIPLPQVVLDAIAAHLGAFPPLGDGFVFVTDARNPIRRTAFGDVWRAAVKAAGAPAGTGFHELRHFYASLLISHRGASRPCNRDSVMPRRQRRSIPTPTCGRTVMIGPARRSILCFLRTMCGLGRWLMDIIPSQMPVGGRVGR
jgi:integrase